jgi:hypothetical protein
MNFALENNTKKIIKLAVEKITDTVDYHKEMIKTSKKTHKMQEQGHENADSVDSQVCDILESSGDEMEFTYENISYVIKIVGKEQKRSFGDIYAEIYVKDTMEMFYKFPINTKVTFNDVSGNPNLAAFNRILENCINGSFHYFVFTVDCTLREKDCNGPISVYCTSVPYIMNLEPLKYVGYNAGPGQMMLNKNQLHKLRTEKNVNVLFDTEMSFDGFDKVLHLYNDKVQEHIDLKKEQMETKKTLINENIDKFY